ncbi:activator of Hsp90 ATPase [Tricharina praecox]|uniref:activator of Hsp90 ATPase n=1 Tax=Tricharina praecox TaxID=43433 RepID=UPI00221ED379|nr:activator of Hsp90 ATPase [Tricharina praecox]KAI5859179.1 activator of Hsp90 ATPase [Tricharina praecox]
MVLHNPNNWHWVNKDAREWTKDYFSENLTVISAEENGVSAKITKVLSIEGDCDVNQRKGKVVTIFDLVVKLEYSGKNADGVEANGTIVIPEVAHDTEEGEYVFDISNYADTKDKQVIRDLVRTQITPQLRKAFARLSPDLIEHHAKDIQHVPATDPAKKAATTATTATTTSSSAQAAAKPSKSAETAHSKGRVLNTVTVSETYEFNTSAEQLYQTFVDPQRVTAFTRTPPQEFEPKEGGKFNLFGGNVVGTFKTLEQNKKIIQDWRLGSWPKDHYSTMNLVFDQGSDSTNLRVTWTGVPVGQDEVSKRNFEDYYVRSIKATFGYAGSFPSRVVSSSSAPKKHKAKKTSVVIKGASWQDMTLEIMGPVLVGAAIAAAAAYVARLYMS